MSSSRIQWQKFTFFNKEIYEGNVEQILGKPISCAVAEGGSLVFGDYNGNVTFISDTSSLAMYSQYKLFRNEITGLACIYHPIHRQRQFIIACGYDNDDSGGGGYFVKIYEVNDMSRPLHSFPISTAGTGDNSSVSTFSVLPDGSQIAIGFSSGLVKLYTGSFLGDDTLGKQAKGQILQLSHPYPVSGLHFIELISLPNKNMGRNIKLYVVMDTDHVRNSDSHVSGGSTTIKVNSSNEDQEVYIYIHTYIYIYIQFVHTFIYAYIHICIYICIYV
jgi:WD40 repeat protein